MSIQQQKTVIVAVVVNVAMDKVLIANVIPVSSVIAQQAVVKSY